MQTIQIFFDILVPHLTSLRFYFRETAAVRSGRSEVKTDLAHQSPLGRMKDSGSGLVLIPGHCPSKGIHPGYPTSVK